MFKTNTIDSILKDFSLKITKLRTIAKDKSDEADFMEQLAEESMNRARALEAEAARAGSIADKIGALIG